MRQLGRGSRTAWVPTLTDFIGWLSNVRRLPQAILAVRDDLDEVHGGHMESGGWDGCFKRTRTDEERRKRVEERISTLTKPALPIDFSSCILFASFFSLAWANRRTVFT